VACHRFSSCHARTPLAQSLEGFTLIHEGSAEWPPSLLQRVDVPTFRRSDRRFRFRWNDSGFPPRLSKSFRINTYETCPIISALTTFRINTYGSVHSKALYPPLESTLMKNRGGGIQLLLIRHATKHVYPEGPRDLSSFPMPQLPSTCRRWMRILHSASRMGLRDVRRSDVPFPALLFFPNAVPSPEAQPQ